MTSTARKGTKRKDRASGSRISLQKVSTTTDKYSDLVRLFPLRPIRTTSEHKKAIEHSISVGKLLNSDITDKGAEDYYTVLSLLIREYESALPKRANQAKPRDIVKFLMEQHHLRQVDLIEEFGTQGLVSEFLNGKRELSKRQIRNLSERFKIDPSLLI